MERQFTLWVERDGKEMALDRAGWEEVIARLALVCDRVNRGELDKKAASREKRLLIRSGRIQHGELDLFIYFEEDPPDLECAASNL